MKHLLKIIFAVSVAVGVNYYLDNSLEKVQNTTIKDLAYVMLGDDRNPARKEQREKRLDIALNKMEKNGIIINRSLLASLEENSYIKDLQWNTIADAYPGLDQITLNLNLSNNEFKIPVVITFLVKPKPSGLAAYTDPNISKLLAFLTVEVSNNGKSRKYSELEAFHQLQALYSESTTKSFELPL